MTQRDAIDAITVGVDEITDQAVGVFDTATYVSGVIFPSRSHRPAGSTQLAASA